MLNFDRIDVSERTALNGTSEPKKCDICRY